MNRIPGKAALAAAALLILASCSGKEPGAPVSRGPAGSETPARSETAVPPPEAPGRSSAADLPGNAGGGDRPNAPPQIRSVKFVPATFRPGDTLGIEVTGSDPDGDDVTFGYAWKKNGLPAGEESRIGGALKRGDRIAVSITPFDGKARGESLTLEREVRNVPPSIEGVENPLLTGDLYTCRIAASDADGDPLAYALKEAPPGMSIEKATGTIRWEISPEVRGRVPAVVAVTDGNGGEATYYMVVTIGEETPGAEEPEKDGVSGETRQAAPASRQQ